MVAYSSSLYIFAIHKIFCDFLFLISDIDNLWHFILFSLISFARGFSISLIRPILFIISFLLMSLQIIFYLFSGLLGLKLRSLISLLSFLKLCFIDYAIIIVPIFPLCLPPPSNPYSLRYSPHLCSCPLVIRVSSLATPFPILYFTPQRLFVQGYKFPFFLITLISKQEPFSYSVNIFYTFLWIFYLTNVLLRVFFMGGWVLCYYLYYFGYILISNL